MNKKIIIASDHGGYELKNEIKKYLENNNYEILDIGTNSTESCDYPIYAQNLCREILNNNFNKGILVCGTGLGMQIAANRNKGIRAVCVTDTFSARMSREHNNSNVLCLGGRVLGKGLVLDIVDIWLKTDFLGDRHQKRIDLFDK